MVTMDFILRGPTQSFTVARKMMVKSQITLQKNIDSLLERTLISIKGPMVKG